MRRLQIAVIGYNEDKCNQQSKQLAYEVGKEIAKSGAVLICGGLGGVMESACKGAKEENGVTIGIIPQDSFSFANTYCDIVICTGIGFARDFIVASSCDGIIAIGGGVGTLIEMCVGYMVKKIIISLVGAGGTSERYANSFLDERQRVLIYKAESAAQAVNMILNKNKTSNNIA
jgi:uncharacterized protein (TIGR00725 family)